MNILNSIDMPNPPTYFGSVKNGFNAVANHIQIILFPICLDLFLLFGPQLRITNLVVNWTNNFLIRFNVLMPIFNFFNENNASPVTEQITIADQIAIIDELKNRLSSVNLFLNLSTFPIGIPSIVIPGAAVNPVGRPFEIELSSILLIFGLIIFLTLIGLGFGVLYFNALVSLLSENDRKYSIKLFFWQYSQLFLIGLIFLALLFIIFLPGIIIFSFLSAINPFIGSLLFFGFLFLLIWLSFPLIYTIHGILIYKKNILSAALTSFHLVRNSVPGSGLFISLVILIYLLFNSLWRIPPSDSWLVLAAIAGHAFLFTGLFASTIIYYRNCIEWMRELIKRNAHPINSFKV